MICPLARQFRHGAQHGGLAGARVALHPHGDMRREQDSAHRVALAGVQPGGVQPRLHRLCRRQAPPCVQARAHAGDNVALGVARPVGDEGQVRPPRRRFDQVSVAPEPGDTGVQRVERVPPAPVGQRPGAQVVGGEHRAPLLQVLHGLPHHGKRGRLRPRLGHGGCRCADSRRGPLRCRGRAPGRVLGPVPARSRAGPAGRARPCAAVCKAPPAVLSPACSPSHAPACSPTTRGGGSRRRPASACW